MRYLHTTLYNATVSCCYSWTRLVCMKKQYSPTIVWQHRLLCVIPCGGEVDKVQSGETNRSHTGLCPPGSTVRVKALSRFTYTVHNIQGISCIILVYMSLYIPVFCYKISSLSIKDPLFSQLVSMEQLRKYQLCL